MPKKSRSSLLDLTNYSYPDKFDEWLGYKVEKFDRKKQQVEINFI